MTGLPVAKGAPVRIIIEGPALREDRLGEFLTVGYAPPSSVHVPLIAPEDSGVTITVEAVQ